MSASSPPPPPSSSSSASLSPPLLRPSAPLHCQAHDPLFPVTIRGTTSGGYSDILSGIFSGLLSDIFYDSLSDRFSDILSDIFPHILSDIFSDTLSAIFSDILSDIPGWGPARNTELTRRRRMRRMRRRQLTSNLTTLAWQVEKTASHMHKVQNINISVENRSSCFHSRHEAALYEGKFATKRYHFCHIHGVSTKQWLGRPESSLPLCGLCQFAERWLARLEPAEGHDPVENGFQ